MALAFAATLHADDGQKAAPAPPSLAERFPPPEGYSVEQDVEGNDGRDFWIVSNVRGHILRRFVQAGDDGPSTPADIVRHFGSLVVAQQGIVLADSANDRIGRLDARIPGAKPVWLHVETDDGGGLVDVVALEEPSASTRPVPVDEPSIAGSWTIDELPASAPGAWRDRANRVRDTLAAAIAPVLRPYRGWAWHVRVDAPAPSTAVVVRLEAARAVQTCATCAVTVAPERQTVLVLTFPDANAKPVVDQPWMHGEGTVSIYQRDLVDALLSSPTFVTILK